MESEVVLPSEVADEVADVGAARVQAQVALALLRALQEQDRPGEVLDNEAVGLTLPRRFGLTDVVASQIRRYEREVRLRRRVPEAEVRDLVRLLTRRPDSESLFRRAGRSLAVTGKAARLRRVFPRRVAFALARRSVVRRLRSLLGVPGVRASGGPFEVEVSISPLLEAERGEACELVTGLSRAVLERFVRDPVEVVHGSCRARGDERCVWLLETRE